MPTDSKKPVRLHRVLNYGGNHSILVVFVDNQPSFFACVPTGKKELLSPPTIKFEDIKPYLIAKIASPDHRGWWPMSVHGLKSIPPGTKCVVSSLDGSINWALSKHAVAMANAMRYEKADSAGRKFFKWSQIPVFATALEKSDQTSSIHQIIDRSVEASFKEFHPRFTSKKGKRRYQLIIEQ